MDLLQKLSSDPEWLTTLPHYLKELPGDASGKRVFRYIDNSTNKAYILLYFPPDAAKSDEFFDDSADWSPDRMRQIDFWVLHTEWLYTHFGSRYTNRIVDQDLARGLVVVEEVGPSLRQFMHKSPTDKTREKAISYYKEMVDLIVRLIKYPIEGTPFNLRIYEDKAFLRELKDFERYCLEPYTKLDLSSWNQLKEQLIDPEIPLFCGHIIHRDFQSRNVLLSKNEVKGDPLYLIDVQDMSLGPRLYDLASLIYEGSAVLSQAEREMLGNHAFDQLKGFLGLTLLDFWNELRRMGLLRILKNLGRHGRYYHESGRMASLENMRGNWRMLETDEKWSELGLTP